MAGRSRRSKIPSNLRCHDQDIFEGQLEEIQCVHIITIIYDTYWNVVFNMHVSFSFNETAFMTKIEQCLHSWVCGNSGPFGMDLLTLPRHSICRPPKKWVFCTSVENFFWTLLKTAKSFELLGRKTAQSFAKFAKVEWTLPYLRKFPVVSVVINVIGHGRSLKPGFNWSPFNRKCP